MRCNIAQCNSSPITLLNINNHTMKSPLSITIDSTAAEPKTTRAAGVAAAVSEGTAKVDFERQAHHFLAANVPQKRAAASKKKAVPKKRAAKKRAAKAAAKAAPKAASPPYQVASSPPSANTKPDSSMASSDSTSSGNVLLGGVQWIRAPTGCVVPSTNSTSIIRRRSSRNQITSSTSTNTNSLRCRRSTRIATKTDRLVDQPPVVKRTTSPSYHPPIFLDDDDDVDDDDEGTYY